MRVDDGQDAKLLSHRQLVVNKVHRPDIIRTEGLLAILPQLRLHPPLRMANVLSMGLLVLMCFQCSAGKS